MLVRLEEIFLTGVRSQEMFKFGTLLALKSAANMDREDVVPVQRGDGTPIEYQLRYKQNQYALGSDPTGATTSICVAGDSPQAYQYVDIEEGTFTPYAVKATFDPEAISRLCFDDLMSQRTKWAADAVLNILTYANWDAQAAVKANSGGVYDFASNTTGLVGTALTLPLIKTDGTPNYPGLRDMKRAFRYNFSTASTPIIVHNDGFLMDLIANREMSIYCCNDSGLDNSMLVQMLGGTNFLDNTGHMGLGNGDLDVNEGLAFSPGVHYFRTKSVNVGDNSHEMPHHIKNTFAVPVGDGEIIFDHELYYDACDGGSWTEQISMQGQVVSKPITVNQTPLNNNNESILLTFTAV